MSTKADLEEQLDDVLEKLDLTVWIGRAAVASLIMIPVSMIATILTAMVPLVPSGLFALFIPLLVVSVGVFCTFATGYVGGWKDQPSHASLARKKQRLQSELDDIRAAEAQKTVEAFKKHHPIGGIE